MCDGYDASEALVLSRYVRLVTVRQRVLEMYLVLVDLIFDSRQLS